MKEFVITDKITIEHIHGISEVQRQAWKMDDIGILPTFETRAISDVGFVYVALAGEIVIGFIYGVHHFPNIHYSHMMAVLPEWQGKGVGYELKKYHFQKARASSHHVEAVQWTVDPLLPNNAYLNFAKLGCYCDIYKVNYYGDPDGDGVGIYAGVPTDRFKVTWPIHTKKVEQRMQDYRQYRITKDELLKRSEPINYIENDQYVNQQKNVQDSFCIEIPSDYQAVKKSNLELALNWRVKFRDLCLKYFDLGYQVIDYHSFKEGEKRLNFYEFSNNIEDKNQNRI